MTVQNVEIKPDVSTEGVARVSARKPVDMQRSAGRLLRAAAEKFYDAEIDIDWDSPWEEGKYFLPEHRVSLYGTKLWEKMSDEQKVELGRHEIVSILSFGIYAENLLSSALLRMSAKGALTDQRALYALNEIGDEARHSTMFARLINKTGLAPYKLPKGFLGFAKILHFVPLGPSVSGATLLIEEILDRAQREAMNDPKMQPQLRQLMKIHVLEEARHITFARLEMVEGMQRRGRISRAWHRGTLAVIANFAYPLLINPKVYPAVGINRLRGLWAQQTSPNYRVNLQFMSEPMIRFFHEAGMMEGKFTMAMWRATRSLPDDLR
ncbi:P-aminobenzoate N-oxygenase AurF [Gordonia malaquae]|uniref:AurF N-oxygenase family protein n=1 Tax=Gordonia malaquae TaxID=410332 RepID=UPI00089B6006|nr:diiron oxygenase [Gordonia malaquae]SED68162.1 P-aminobenzoate N-oxygenase AurF [Gordonia malaquae]